MTFTKNHMTYTRNQLIMAQHEYDKARDKNISDSFDNAIEHIDELIELIKTK